MKQYLKSILVFVALAISAVAQTPTVASIKPKQSGPFDPPRTIQISERDVPTVYGCDGQLLMISMPDSELVRVAGFADADNWKVAVDQAARGQMLVKFRSILNTSALLQVTSNRNYGYTILVKANDGHCDTRVKLIADKPLQTKIQNARAVRFRRKRQPPSKRRRKKPKNRRSLLPKMRRRIRRTSSNSTRTNSLSITPTTRNRRRNSRLTRSGKTASLLTFGRMRKSRRRSTKSKTANRH